MSLIVNRRPRVLEDKVILIRRVLQGDSKIIAKIGQIVSPSDVIGVSTLSVGFRSINLAKALSVSPGDVKKYLQRPMGEIIYKGELLAYKDGSFFSGRKVVVSPTDGIIELINEHTGIIKLKILPQKLQVPAAVFGEVMKIDFIKREVIIKTEATQIFGITGSGKIREGYLKVLGGRGDLIGAGKINFDDEDKILVGGGLIYNQAITQALTFGVGGIITGGINAPDFKSMSGGFIKVAKNNDVGIGILVTEGFGLVPIGEDIYNILVSYKDKFAILDGNNSLVILPSYRPDSITRIKKVSIPIKESEEKLIISEEVLSTDKYVRIVGSSYMGEQGKVISWDKVTTTLPSGVITYMVTVATKSRKLRVPFSNLEIIA